MRSTFFGLNIGYKGLQAQQRALDITGHNIANANTQGYSRQDVIMQPSLPIKVLEGYVGTGVDVADFRRIRDSFLDLQLRTENKSLGEWEAKAGIMGNLEVIFNEPSETSLRSVMDLYWESWQSLAKNPESAAVKTAVVQSGITLADTFNHMDRQFADLQNDITQSIAGKIEEINTLIRQIGGLNDQIIRAEADGSKANDLRDGRDNLADQLSKIVDIGIIEDSLGAYNITIGGRSAVNRTFITELRYVGNDQDHSSSGIEWVDPLTGQSQGEVSIKGGILKGYLSMRDELVPELREKISLLAERIALEVNTLHQAGYNAYDRSGTEFFSKIDDSKPFSASNLTVNQKLKDDIGELAAAVKSPVLAGDGANALALAQLRNKLTVNPGGLEPPLFVVGKELGEPLEIAAEANQLTLTINGMTKTLTLASSPPAYTLAALQSELQNQADLAFGGGVLEISLGGADNKQLVLTVLSGGAYLGIDHIAGSAAEALGIAPKYQASFDDFYRSTVAQLGISAMEAERMLDNQNLLVNLLENKREAISGVSLDEEMADMIRYQHAYSACARLINAMDEMLEIIVNRLGLVGR